LPTFCCMRDGGARARACRAPAPAVVRRWVLAAALFAVHPVTVSACVQRRWAIPSCSSPSAVLAAVFSTCLIDSRQTARLYGACDHSTLTYRVLLRQRVTSIVFARALPRSLLNLTVIVVAERLRSGPAAWASLLPCPRSHRRDTSFGCVTRARVHGLAYSCPFRRSEHSTALAHRVLTALGWCRSGPLAFLWPAHSLPSTARPESGYRPGYSRVSLPGLCAHRCSWVGRWDFRRQAAVNHFVSSASRFVCVTLLPVSNFIFPAGIVLPNALFPPECSLSCVRCWSSAELRRWIAETAFGLVRVQVIDALGMAAPARLAIGLLHQARRAATNPSDGGVRDKRRTSSFHPQAVIDSRRSQSARSMRGLVTSSISGHSSEDRYRNALNLFPSIRHFIPMAEQ